MEIVTKIAPLVLAIIMLGLGLGLSIKDFTRVLKYPKDFFVGALSQIILFPILALILAFVFPIPIELKVGLILLAAAPGGVTTNIISKFADGNVVLDKTKIFNCFVFEGDKCGVVGCDVAMVG